MVKKNNNRKTIKEYAKAYKGSVSSIFISFFIISFGLFLPMLSANEVQDAREGEGRYSPVVSSIWDLSHEGDLSPVQMNHLSDTAMARSEYEWGDGIPGYSSPYDQDTDLSGFMWLYKSNRINDNQKSDSWGYQVPTFADIPHEDINKTNGFYLMSALTETTTWGGNQNLHWTGAPDGKHRREEIQLFLDIDIGDWIKYDASELIYYFKSESNIKYMHTLISVISKNTGNEYTLHNKITDISLTDGVKYETIEIDLEDILNIMSIESYGRMALRFKFISKTTITGGDDVNKEFTTSSPIIFDCNVMGLRPKTNSITVLSIWNIVHSFSMILMGVIMLPQISFGGLAKRLGISS